MKLTGKMTVNIASRVAVTASGALLGIFLARLLGAEEYGLFAFAYSVIYLLLLPTKLGLDSAATKFIAEYAARGDYAKFKGYLLRSSQVLLLTGGLTAAGLILIIALGSVIPEEKRWLLLASLPTLLLLSHLHRDQFVLIGLSRSELSSIPEGVVRAAVLIVLTLPFALLAGGDISAETALFLNGAAVLAALYCSRVLVRRYCRSFRLCEAIPSFETRRWIRTGSFHLMISCAHVILTQTDLFMLGVYLEGEAVGYYAVANQVSTLLLFFSLAINPVLSPRMAAAHTTGDTGALLKAVRYGTNMIFFLSYPVLLAMLIFASPLLILLFGPSYSAAVPILVVLLMAQFAKVLSSPVGNFMTMTGREHTASFVIGGAALLNILLNLILIPRFGALGAATSTAVTALMWNGALILFVWRKYGELLLPRFPREFAELLPNRYR